MKTALMSERFIRELKQLHAKRESKKSIEKQKTVKRQRLTKKQREQVLQKTDGRCHICGGQVRERWQADHVRSHSSGGEHVVENYLAAHPACNNYRWDYLPEEFELILRIGVWARTQMERETDIGKNCIQAFVKYEKQKVSRRRKL